MRRARRDIAHPAVAVLRAAVLVVVLGGLACAAPAATAPPRVNALQATLDEPAAKTPEVSTAELLSLLAAGTTTVLDARPVAEFAMSHIPGARNVSARPGLPMSEYVSDVHEVTRLVGGKKDSPLVLYCNGPFCGKSKRLADELVAAGFSNVRRYQLGIPVWRALVGVSEIELEGIKRLRASDQTAVFIDARERAAFEAGSLKGARHVPVDEVLRAKDDGRLPMEDHNTRIVVLGADAAQARAVVEALAKNAFHNASYFAGGYSVWAGL